MGIKAKVTMATFLLATTGTLYVAHNVSESLSNGIDALVLQSEELHQAQVTSVELDLVAKEARVVAESAIVSARAANQIASERVRTSQTIERDLKLAWVWNTSMGLLYGLMGVVPTAVGGLILWRVVMIKRREDEDRKLVNLVASGAVPVSREFLLNNPLPLFEMAQIAAENAARVKMEQAQKVGLPSLTTYTNSPTYSPTTTNDKEVAMAAKLDSQKSEEDDTQGAGGGEKSSVIYEALQSQGVPTYVSLEARGPQVETYSIRPGRRACKGRIKRVTVREIIKHEPDIAMALNVSSVRMTQAAGFIACEVARDEREFVMLADMLASPAWSAKQKEQELPLALGANTLGEMVVEDLTEMPHILVGGATNMGKSVVIRSIIFSLCQQAESSVKLTLIDPKEVEFEAFKALPHVARVITNMDQAAHTLESALIEMDRRASLFKKKRVQKISEYNSKVKAPLPYIVIVVDEMADLMATHGEDVEESIVRLAQKARFAGIHLVLATQRPDAQTITPLIRANMPARLSVRCMAQGDSKTVLGEVGAEKLMDKGDSLFKSAIAPLTRLQSSYQEVEEGVRAILLTHGANYTSEAKRKQSGSKAEEGRDDAIDYAEADAETRSNFIKMLHLKGLSLSAIQSQIWGRSGGRRHKERRQEIETVIASLHLNGSMNDHENGHLNGHQGGK